MVGGRRRGKWFGRSAIQGERASERRRPAGCRSILECLARSRWGRKKRERERMGREREWAMILTHCLGARQAADGRAAADADFAAIPKLRRRRRPILAGTRRSPARSLARSRRLSWDFFSTTTFVHRGPLKVSQFGSRRRGRKREEGAQKWEEERRVVTVWPRKRM